MIGALLRRDLAKFFPFAGGGAALPLVFFVAVAMLYPFAVGPDAALLARTGGGVVWIAALLAAILPLERLVAEDIELGVFEQLRLRGVSEEVMMAVRLLAHWLSFGPPLVLATFPAAALLALEGPVLHLLLLGLIAGTPGLAAIGLIIAALTASLRAGAALSGLLLVAIAPFAAGAAIRAARES